MVWNMQKYRESDRKFCKMQELSCGKDTTTGHWEMAGIVTPDPFRNSDGFPKSIHRGIFKRTGRKILCNLPYSGTQVIYDYGREQEETGALIVYTSADSVCQDCSARGDNSGRAVI